MENYLSDETRQLIENIEASRADEESKARIIDNLKADEWKRYQANQRKPIGTTSTPTIEAGRVIGVEEYEAKKRELIPGYDEARERVLAGLAESKRIAGAETADKRGPFDFSIQQREAESQRVKEWAARKEVEIQAMREARTQREVASYDNATSLRKREVLKKLSPEALARIQARTTT